MVIAEAEQSPLLQACQLNFTSETRDFLLGLVGKNNLKMPLWNKVLSILQVTKDY